VSNAVLQRLVSERQQANEAIDKVLDQTNEEERDPSDSERELIGRYRSRLQELEPQIVELLELEETRGAAADARAALERQAPQRPAPAATGEAAAEGEAEEYPTFARYARDVMLTRFQQIGATVEPQERQRAQQRLQRAVEQVLVADVGPLVAPQYLAQIVQVIDKSRPIVATSRQVGLTSGKIQYPKIGTRPQVAEQVTEKTEVGVGTMTVTMEEQVAKTFLTSANFSWQTVQWSNPDALALWFDLAAESYAEKTEAEAGALLAAADATPTAVAGATLEDWMAAITAAAGAVYIATGRYANTIYADPTSGFEVLGLVSAQAPVFLATGAGNLTGSFPSVGGLQLVISRGLPADTVIVGDSQSLLTAETPGAPVDLRAVEPSIGGLEVGIIGAFLAEIVEPGAFAELTPPVAT
jgi:HK97 family phage major capsid protein